MAYLTDGHPTTVTFYALGTGVSILFKEVSVTPPGVEGGGPNDTTTMRNVAFRTKQPKHLKELSDGACTFQYDPAILDQIMSLINVNGVIRIDWPDGSAWEFYGWLNNFTPGEVVEGAMPTATGTINCSNQDDAGNEIGPDYQAAAA
jgi:hypothetical protein